MSVAEVQAVDVHEVFTDPLVAELAEAVAAGKVSRVAELAKAVNLSAQGDKNVTLLQWALLFFQFQGEYNNFTRFIAMMAGPLVSSTCRRGIFRRLGERLTFSVTT